MKIKYEFEPNEDNDDRYELDLIQNSRHMYLALSDLHDLKRSLYKGYKYLAPTEIINTKQAEGKYSLVNIDELLDDLNEILVDSKYYDIN